MHLKPSIDIIQFLDQAAKCHGNVLFITPKGDTINLKSVLSGYVFIFLIRNPDNMESGTVICNEEKDRLSLKKYMQKI